MLPVPIPFKRGQTFSYLFVLPDEVEINFFSSWQPKAQIFRQNMSTPLGLIANLAAYWADNTAKSLVLHHNFTDKWPLGLAELDVKFSSVDGAIIISQTITFNIERGITK